MKEFYDVFISYGRADSKQFAEKLCDRLLCFGLTVWFDQNDIPPSVDYQKEIDAGIERAHNFIFIIAPHSTKSLYCRKEIDLAVQHHKRIIPLLHINGDRTQMHPSIRKFNWINFQEGIDDFEKSFQDLINSIQTQSDYVNQHTYFLLKALEWKRHYKQSNYLLIGKERQQAEAWLKRKFKTEQNPCTPTDLHCEFICESTKNANNLMVQVLIVHVQQNAALAESIAKSLMRNHITVWREQTDLRTGIEQQDSIKQGIEESDNIIFLLSTHSLISTHCLAQRTYAAGFNKRIILVRLENLEPSQIPEDIRGFQFLDFTEYHDEIQYQFKIQELVKELQQDALYFEQHKILLTKALKWKNQNRNPSILLRGYNLRYFEAWLKVAKQRSEHPSLPLHEEFIAESLRHPGDSSLEVFISYSRSDSDFARRLNDALQELGKTTWFDQQSITSGVDFQEEIEKGIEQSDNFLFIISERSITSPYCASEVEYAQKLNKRFVTVIYQESTQIELHSAIAKVQWIDFKKHGGDFHVNFSELVRTLETDREHVKSHTKWSLKAMEWDEKGRDHSLLLRGSSLQEAREWWQEWSEKGNKKKPEPTELQKEYIQRSEQAQREEIQAEKARQRAKEIWQRAAFSALGLGLVASSLLSAAAWSQYQKAKNNEAKAKINEVKAIAKSSASFSLAKDKLRALVEAVRAKQLSQKLSHIDANTQNLVDSALQQAVYQGQESNRLSAHTNWVLQVAWNPDHKMLASASADKTIRLWKVDGTLLKTLSGHQDWVWSVAWSPDGQMLASASHDKTIKLWKANGTLLKTLTAHQRAVLQVAWSPDGKMLASASSDKTIKLWKADGTFLKTLSGHQDGVRSVAWSPDAKVLASASDDKIIKLWKANGTLLKTLTGHQDGVRSVAWSPDAKVLASASDDKTIKLWKANGTLLKTLAGHQDGVQSVAWSQDGQMLVSTSRDQTIKVWTADGILLKTLKGHQDWVQGATWSSDSKMLASASDDKTIRLWKIDDTLLKTLAGHQDWVEKVTWSPDGSMIASASDDETVKLWKADGTLLKTLAGHQDVVWDAAWSPDGKMLASASEDKTVKLWKADGTLLKTLSGHQDMVRDAAWSPDGKVLASASHDKTIKLWKADGTLIKTLAGHQESVHQVAWSPVGPSLPSGIGQILASNSGDKTIKLWKTDGTLLKTLTGHQNWVNQVAWSPDGKVLASASEDKTIKLWKADGTLLQTLIGHQESVNQVAWSPNGKILASASNDKTIKLWKADGTFLQTLAGHQDVVRGLAWSPDSQMLASNSGDKTIKLWTADTTVLKTLLSQEEEIDQLAWHPNRKIKTLLFSAGSNELLASLIEDPLTYGCNWVRDYLKHSNQVEESDRHLCDNLKNSP
jgi:WD40 repeat protein